MADSNDEGLLSVALSRRQALAVGAGGAALLATAYATLRQVGTYEAPSQDFVTLTPKEAVIFERLGEFMLPGGNGLPGSGGDAITLAGIDRLLTGLPPHKLTLVRALPHVFEHGTTFDRYGARCMSKLPDDRCERYLEDWANDETAIRAQLWAALKMVFGMTYFERHDVLKAVDCPIPCGGTA